MLVRNTRKEKHFHAAKIDVKISSKISDLKPLHASWIVDLYRYVEEEKQMIKNSFQVPGISEAVNKV